MKKILVVNNNDSFVYNLVEILRLLQVDSDVIICDELTFPLTTTCNGIILSPGPGIPAEYPQLEQLIHRYHKTYPILGVCLGHQSIASYFGASLVHLNHPLHGHTSTLHITHESDTLFLNVPNLSNIGRYHSWVIAPDSLPDCLQSIAKDEHDNIMAIKHSYYPIYGVQFHPESIISGDTGKQLISNWISDIVF